MTAGISQYACPAATLAKSLLEVWLSGDHYQLRVELEQVSRAPDPPDTNDEPDRIDLLKCMAWRMKDASDLFKSRSESPRIGVWLDLLDHLSATGAPNETNIRIMTRRRQATR